MKFCFGSAASRTSRRLLLAGVSAASLLCATLPSLAASNDPVAFSLPAQPLKSALVAFATQAQLQLVLKDELVVGRSSAALDGRYTPREALQRLLAGTGLQFDITDADAVIIRRPGAAADPKRAGAELAPTRQAAQGASAVAAQPSPRAEEIVVTAQKRAERLQDVPVPVTALSAQSLVNSNQLQLKDYYSRIPGLNLTLDPYGAPQVTIRGLTTGGYTNPTVAVMVDDIPYGASSSLAFAEHAPDIDPNDLAQIEVLRGPQGTLYGASSLGGLIKYVTAQPSTERVSGRVQVGTSAIENGDGLGYTTGGAINVPLSPEFAVRVSAFSRKEAGYIDNVLTRRNGANETSAEGAHLSALWRPTDRITLKLSALLQHAQSDSAGTVNVGPGFHGLQQDVARGTGGYDRRLQAYSATLTADLGFASLTSVTGYNVSRVFESLDYTSALGSFTQSAFGVTGTPLNNYLHTRKFTQELRLASPTGDRIEWLLGAFLNQERTSFLQDIPATDVRTGAFVGRTADFLLPSKFAEYAAFADATWHVTDRLALQVGARQSRNRQTYNQTFEGLPSFFGGPTPIVYPEAHASGSAFTWLVTPSFKITPDLMVYGRIASGYRPGGPNIALVPIATPTYKPDTTTNYEAGIKGDLLNHALTVDASIFYIDWSDIQISLNDASGFTYRANGSGAKSQGVELSLELRPLAGLDLSGWVSYTDAVLTRPFPASSNAFGRAGDRLPYTSRFSGNLAAQYEFALSSDIDAFVGTTLTYVGRRIGQFTGSATRQELPAYARLDLRAGAKYENWSIDLFANNVTDRRGMLSGGIDLVPTNAYQYIQPRTIGLSIARSF